MSVMFIASNDWLHIGFRLLMALLVGCLIGLNRQKGGFCSRNEDVYAGKYGVCLICHDTTTG